jgi:Mn-dependent DtxR family transcriptional regulator
LDKPVHKTIEDCAKSIVSLLQKAGEANILRLSEHLSERSVIVYQALGWLAREGRIRYETRGDQVYVALASGPREGPADATIGV